MAIALLAEIYGRCTSFPALCAWGQVEGSIDIRYEAHPSVGTYDLAHRVFESIKGRSRPDMPIDLQWRFGRIQWGKFKPWLEQEAGEFEQIVEEIER